MAHSRRARIISVAQDTQCNKSDLEAQANRGAQVGAALTDAWT
jgi:hypothetical protein